MDANKPSQITSPYSLGVMSILLVVMIWSGWIIVSSWGVHQDLTPWDITFLRFTAAAVITSPLLYLRRKKLNDIFNIKVALCSLGCGFPYTMCSFFGLADTPASNAGVIVNGLLPILVALLAFLWIREGISSKKIFGIALIALANALILLEGGGANLRGMALLLSAALFLAGYTVSMRVWKISVGTMVVAVPWVNAMLFLPIWLLAPSTLSSATTNEILLQVFYQGALVSVVALYLMTYAIHTLGSVTASTFMGLVPVTAAGLAFLVLGEPVAPLTVAAVITCSLGIVLYNLRSTKK